MGQYELRKKGLSTLKEIDLKRENYIIVHYACDSFTTSQTISSICVRHFGDSQTESFSLNKTSEELNIPTNEIASNLPEIEKKIIE